MIEVFESDPDELEVNDDGLCVPTKWLGETAVNLAQVGMVKRYFPGTVEVTVQGHKIIIAAEFDYVIGRMRLATS